MQCSPIVEDDWLVELLSSHRTVPWLHEFSFAQPLQYKIQVNFIFYIYYIRIIYYIYIYKKYIYIFPAHSNNLQTCFLKSLQLNRSCQSRMPRTRFHGLLHRLQRHHRMWNLWGTSLRRRLENANLKLSANQVWVTEQLHGNIKNLRNMSAATPRFRTFRTSWKINSQGKWVFICHVWMPCLEPLCDIVQTSWTIWLKSRVRWCSKLVSPTTLFGDGVILSMAIPRKQQKRNTPTCRWYMQLRNLTAPLCWKQHWLINTKDS